MEEAFKSSEYVYVLEQKDLIIWSSYSTKNLQKIVDNDRLRVFGIMFGQDVREHIALLRGSQKPSLSRMEIDERPSLLRGLWSQLKTRMNDDQCLVDFRQRWDFNREN